MLNENWLVHGWIERIKMVKHYVNNTRVRFSENSYILSSVIPLENYNKFPLNSSENLLD